ncbi:MAG TPA: polymer-forming cytoskeletal protein [Candidatus Heimdallarchaeota archaeon]|nr:polymer-forming cytoskeletal protein [Candidatus Heimdallarchaeota archaeon]
MKERKREFEEDKITGFFDKDTEIKGELSFKGSFRIDGRFKGKIDSDSMLIIGESGKVDADIKIGYMVIDGEVKGNIQASERVDIHSNGRVIGTITTPKLVVEEGAYLEATCQTTDKMPPQSPEKSTPKEKEDEEKDTIPTGPEL